MTDLYDQRIDEMKAQEYLRDNFCWPPARHIPKQWVQNVRNHERLAAYKRKREALNGCR